MRKNKLLFMIALSIMFFTWAIRVNAAMQVTPVASDALSAEYSDDYFFTSAVNQSNNLAQLSIVASDATYKDTTTFLKNCGFLDIVDKKIIKNQQTQMLHPIKVTIGHKMISFSQENYDLYAILVRGTTDAMEWVSNFDLSSLDKEKTNQFVVPKDQIKILFESYKNDYFTPGAMAKIWVTGHSRGGAVANLLAHELSSKYSISNVYAYTFASAKVVTKKFNDANIFNYIIQEDIVPKVPPAYMRYGKDVVLSTKGHMYKLYQQMTSKRYERTVVQAHSLEAYMCAFLNTITFPEEDTTDNNILASGDCGATSSDNLKWTAYDDDNNGSVDRLVISGNGKMKDYEADSTETLENCAPWLYLNNSGSYKLVLEDGITHIGQAAFSKCKFTNTLKIPDTVVSIGKDAFYGCSGFTGSLTIPQNVTSIGPCAFYGCSGFTGSLIIPDNVTDIDEYAFAHCYGFTGSITISKKMKKISTCTFAQCKGINGKQVIPENITYVGDGAFFDTTLSEYWINNVNCYLGDGCLDSYDDAYNTVKKIIYGYEGSTAQAYATQYNHEFCLIQGEVSSGKLVPLKEYITYTQYDFTGNGKTDSFKCITGSQRGDLKLYLNGKYKQTIFIGKGANIYWCKTDKKNPYLLAESRLYGGHELKIYKYSGGKFKEVNGNASLNKVFSFSEFSRLEGNILYVTSTPGTRNTQSFKGITNGIYVETKFKLQGNKVTRVTWNSKVTGRKVFYAQNSFRTSKLAAKLNVKDGPRVKKGQKITLNYVKLGGGTYVYRITVGGKTGWFKDSSSIRFS